MYRIAKLAELLNVSTVQIHEKLIAFREELAPFCHKEKGITLVSDPGLLQLKHIFEKESLEKAQNEPPSSAPEESVEEEATGALSEIDRRELELLNLKDRLNQSRSELHRLNLESRKLDEALLHYMNILKEDLDKRIRQEDQLEGLIRLQKRSESSTSQIEFFADPSRK